MYCDCFTAGLLCDENCSCCDCCNTTETQDMVRKARVIIKARNKKAFKAKIVKVDGPENVEDGVDLENEDM